MIVPGLGEVTKDDEFGWLYSTAIPVKMFGGKLCRIVLEGYEEDNRKDDFHTAISNFLMSGPEVLRKADEHLARYFNDFKEWWEDDGKPPITSLDQLWEHVHTGNEPRVSRRHYGDKGIYVSIECNCDWEVEHGLQIVIKNGLSVNKLGQYDGHLTNSDAFDNPKLENKVYCSFEDIS